VFIARLYISILLKKLFGGYLGLWPNGPKPFDSQSSDWGLQPAFSNASALPGLVPDFSLFKFAAEDEGRTEDPTELRKRREREKGHVPKSHEIPAALGTLGGLIALFVSSGWILTSIAQITKVYVGSFNSLGPFTEASAIPMMIQLSKSFFLMLLPFFGAVMLMGIIGNVSQVGFLFTLEPLRPKLSNISFSFNKMIEKTLFSRQIYINLAKTLIKLTLIGFASYYIISSDFLDIIKTGSMGVGASLRSIAMMSFKLALILTIILLVMSIPDYIFQRLQYLESLKMTKQEIKQEFREQEGDPLIKQRQRQRALDMMRTSVRSAIKTADLVITNPTHYAVAIRFLADDNLRPVVVAKGEDFLALMIRQDAKANGIDVVEHKPLARELYRTVAVNEAIPEKFFIIIIEILKGLPGLLAKIQRESAA